MDAALDPTSPVIVNATVVGNAVPGAVLAAAVAVEILDGDAEVISYLWQQENSVDVNIGSPNTAATAVTLPAVQAYKDELIALLKEPPITEEQLPPNVPFPG
jgi:hypothetical protein